MPKKILLFIAIILYQIGSSQNHWKRIYEDDGLLTNNINLIEVENDQKWWLASDIGISLIENETQITNYLISGHDINNDAIVDLEIAQGKLWIATTNGLYSFDGHAFQRFGANDGFTDLNIKGLSKQSNGNLWIGTPTTASMYDGQNFTHHDSVQANYIAVDENDRVYAFRFPGVFPTAALTKVLDNGRWNHFGVNFSQILYGSYIKELDNKIYLVKNDGYWELEYPQTQQYVSLNLSNATPCINEFLVTSNELYTSNGISLFRQEGNDLEKVALGSINLIHLEIQELANTSTKLLVGTKNGLLYNELSNTRIFKSDSLSTNKVISHVFENSTGFSFDPSYRTASFGFPKDDPTYAIYSSRFIVVNSSLSGNQMTAANLPPFEESRMGPLHDVYSLGKAYFVKISKQEIEYHKNNYAQSNYQMPETIRDWPAIGDTSIGVASDLAPFVDHNQNGCYDPQNGDYPLIKGDEAIYWITHNAGIWENLKLEYHYMMYAFNSSTEAELNQCQFLQCRIINRGDEDLDSVKVGFFFDGDLGNPGDDYFGCDSAESISYFYNGDGFDEGFQGQPGFGSNIPAVGAKFLSDVMTNHIYYQDFSGQTNPTLNVHFWNLMYSRYIDGRRLIYGGIPEDSVVGQPRYTNFMFSGDPSQNTGWTARRTWPNNTPSPPGDRRSISSFAPLKIKSGESKTFELVMGYGRKDSVISHFENVTEMKRVLAIAANHWNNINTPAFTYGQKDDCPQAIGLTENGSELSKIKLYPNPSTGYLNLESELKIERLAIFSVSGNLVYEKQIDEHYIGLNLSGLNRGIYLIRIQTADGKWLNEKIILD